jgi:chromosome partitioning protein
MTKTLTIAQQKGGAGKTTLVAHLAVALSQRGRRIAVIDIDPQGSLTRWHQLREERFGEGYTGLTFSHLSGWRLGSELSRLKRNHDLILIDSPPHTETEAKTAIRSADLVLIPVQPSPTDLWATQATLDLAAHERIPVKVVLNRIAPNAKLAVTIAKQLPFQTKTRLGNRVAFASALMEGRCVTETQPTSPAALEIKALAEEIWEVLGFKAEEEAMEKERAAEMA